VRFHAEGPPHDGGVARLAEVQWSHLTTATVVLVVLLFFTRPLSLSCARHSSHVVLFGVEPGIILALVLSLLQSP